MQDLFASLYHGQPQIALYKDGALGGYSDPCNVTELKFQLLGDAKIVSSGAKGELGQALDLVYVGKPTTFELTINRSNRDLLAAALLGTGSAYSQDAATAQTATATLILNEWVQLKDATGEPIRNIANVTITSKVLGTDFAVLGKQGQIKALTSGCAGSHSITCDMGGVTGSTIVVATESKIEFSVNMLVNNAQTEKEGFLWIPKAICLPGDAAQFMVTDHNTWKFTGHIIKMPGLPLVRLSPELTFS